ncbi:MAG: YIP1 family protein [Candidatus Zixiibacteriota bacterium]
MENLNSTEPTVGPVASPNGASGLSLKGLFEIFYQPFKFFTKLKENPKILVPSLAVIIISLISIYLISDILVKMQLESEAMQQRLQGQPLPPNVQFVMKINIIIFAGLASVLLPLVTAGIAFFWGNFVYGGKARFKQVLSVVLYGQFLFDVGGLIASLIIMAKGSFMAPFSLGVLAAQQGFDSIPFIALSKIDLFNIWEIIVIGIGLAVIYNFERNKGYTISVLSVGLLSILHIIIAAIGDMIM